MITLLTMSAIITVNEIVLELNMRQCYDFSHSDSSRIRHDSIMITLT